MAINISFNGATIYKPGAYSEIEIDLSGGFPLSPTGLVALFGEAPMGTPGANVPDISKNVYTPDELPLIISTYGSGSNIADACQFLFSPAADAAIPSGAQAVYIYKTNASTQAILNLPNSYGELESSVYGTSGNLITFQSTLVAESPASQTGDLPIVPVVPSVNFALLAASAITNTGTVAITGDVGIAPGTAITPGGWTVSGSIHSDDLTAINAQANAAAQFASLNTLVGTPISATLDGQTLTPGVYKESSGTFNLAQSGAGTLTLNGAGMYVFQCSSTLVTGAGGLPTITLSGGATAANVFWVVGSSATINVSGSGVFQGNIIANTSITLDGGSVNGSLTALHAAITITSATAITAQAQPASTANIAQGQTLRISINGAAPISYLIPASANIAALLVLLTAAFPGLTFSQNVANDIVVTMNAGSNLQRNGNGRSFEILSALAPAVDAKAALGLVNALETAAIEPMDTLVLNQTNTLTKISQTVGGNIVISLGFTDPALLATSASVSISPTAMTLVVAGGPNAGTNVLTMAAYSSVSQLVAAINLIPGWSASVANVLYGQLPVAVLDKVSSVAALSVDGSQPARIKKDAYEVQQFFLQAGIVALLGPGGSGLPSGVGLIDNQVPVGLTGGSLGGTSSAAIADALLSFQAFHVNSVLPLFSRDASADIADGLTDPSSTYTIAAINQAVKTHCALMATTINRSERQGYCSLKDTFLNCQNAAQNLADARIQLGIQDVLQNDTGDNLIWFQPWAFMACLAGARGGSPIGTPMTFKYMNVSGIRQTAQPMTTPDANIVNDFNPNIEYVQAIENGITFMEQPQTGGFRVVVDNTTYGKDANWVYNRANVLYASDVLAFDLRNQLEAIYVGVKNTVKATEVKSTVESILQTYVGQGITVSTSDAPNGYIPGTLVVNITGNVITIGVTVKLVEGIDFVLATITLTRASSSA